MHEDAAQFIIVQAVNAASAVDFISKILPVSYISHSAGLDIASNSVRFIFHLDSCDSYFSFCYCPDGRFYTPADHRAGFPYWDEEVPYAT